jgi:hypothetical protein
MPTKGKQGSGSYKKYSTSKNKDGKPRKLRKVTNVRAARRQARKIKENQLGRKLKTKELVGHKDHTRFNNKPSNLQLTNQKKHQKTHPGKKGSREATKKGHK